MDVWSAATSLLPLLNEFLLQLTQSVAGKLKKDIFSARFISHLGGNIQKSFRTRGEAEALV